MPLDGQISRRSLLYAGGLGLGLTGLAAVSGCSASSGGHNGHVPGMVQPSDPVVADLEAARSAAGSGATRRFSLTAARTTVNVGGQEAATWAYDGVVPGPELRARAGDRLVIGVRNELPEETTVHWHGIRLRNDMDGVPGHTQDAIAAGASFEYDFIAPDPGTYFFHPHVGLQLDRGLYAPLIIEDPAEPGDYDAEWVVVLDDWLDGIAGDPDGELQRLRRESTGMMGQDSGISYPVHLLCGRPPEDPQVFEARPGARVRIRLINAGSDTTYRVALGEHDLTVTHKDGIPTTPTRTDALLVSMGERYDLLVTLGDGAFPLVASAEEKDGRAYAIVRTSPSAAAPAPEVSLAELSKEVLFAPQLVGDPSYAPRGQEGAAGEPDVAISLQLGIRGRQYEWLLNGKTFEEAEPLTVSQGDVVRVEYFNATHAIHPMHLHGHSFRLVSRGSWHDTVLVGPMASVAAQFVADNPGLWMLHCHNIYHAEAGMMATLGYRA